jgi:hypothetical protein
MKKALVGVILLLAAGCGVCAQEEGTAQAPANAGANFSESSAPQVTLFPAVDAGSFAPASALGEASAVPTPTPLPAAPAAKPKYVFFGDRDDYRWQLGVGLEFFRFQSNVISASLVGLNTSVTYYTNSWFAVEGDVLTGFAPEIYGHDHVKTVGGTGGIRIGGRKARWEPWGHAQVGGNHLQPQTAAGSRHALMALAGGGVDYRVHSRLSLRLEGDWVYTRYFSQNQNNYQGVAGVVFHF